MNRIITLTLPCEIMFTRLASQTASSVAGVLSDNRQPESENRAFAHAFELAVSEAFTNAVIYGEERHHPEPVTITFICEQQQLTVTVRDSNPPFSIETPEPVIEQYPEKGFGLMIMRKLMDKVTYNREEGSNVISLSKQFQTP